jgi:hypothetical protein
VCNPPDIEGQLTWSRLHEVRVEHAEFLFDCNPIDTPPRLAMNFNFGLASGTKYEFGRVIRHAMAT